MHTTYIKWSEEYIASGYFLLFLYAVLLKLSYVCMPLLLQLLIWASYNLDRCYLLLFTTYTVIDVLLIMCLLAFFVTSADKKPVICIFMVFTNILPEAICCLETLNVYVVVLMLFCIIM